EATRAAQGGDAFAAAREAGRLLRLPQLIERALAELADTPPAAGRRATRAPARGPWLRAPPGTGDSRGVVALLERRLSGGEPAGRRRRPRSRPAPPLLPQT